MYYRYWMDRDGAHDTTAHYGIRTVGPKRKEVKLIYYYADGMDIRDNGRFLGKIDPRDPPLEHVKEWECFDLDEDPYEMKNVYKDPEYKDIIKNLKDELHELQNEDGDEPNKDEID